MYEMDGFFFPVTAVFAPLRELKIFIQKVTKFFEKILY